MPRPRRCRWVGFHPSFNYFGPRGKATGEVVLKVEELESLRLKDLLQMDQTEAAKLMNVSQSTFHRILTEARQKVVDALVNGKVIKVYGGDYTLRNLCFDCKTEWSDPAESCPECGSTNIFHRSMGWHQRFFDQNL
ncbi:MAG: DUF134 domain-containing protein [Candidatus Syntrophoarchaeum sp.]|nr:DUF134 domain-containing protein [Candidatus Syntrophoarchaeum sp.]